MKKIILNSLIVMLLGIILISCKQNKIEGIKIDDTLYTNQSFLENRQLRNLIKQTLDKDEKALAELNDFWCGGGAGCYDLGFIITQIIYKIGEDEFIEMLNKLNKEDILEMKTLIMAGLEYGDNEKDGEMDNKKIENEFPNIQLILEERLNKE